MPPKRAAAKKARAKDEPSSEPEVSEDPAVSSEEPEPSPKPKASRKRAAAAPKKAAAAAAKEEAPAKKVKAAGGGGKGGKLAAGDKLPEFELETDEGTIVKSSDLVAESGVIIFAYPRANTPGCTKQACGFRDNHGDIAAAGFKVFGISADKPKSQSNWRTKNSFPYNLLCDPSRAALKALGIASGDKIIRSHIVVAKGGEILDVRYQISPGDSFAEATKTAQANKQ